MRLGLGVVVGSQEAEGLVFVASLEAGLFQWFCF
jgi:hypothetical protein